MAEGQKSLPKWILIVSGLFALFELMVSLSLYFSPQSVVQTVDHNATGVDYLIYMWATRQFALGFIFGFATFKKSVPMLTIAMSINFCPCSVINPSFIILSALSMLGLLQLLLLGLRGVKVR
jgi:hypothetical protein